VLNNFKIFDSHFHIIDKRFSLIPNNGYIPDEFTCDDYLHRTSAYDLCGGAIVSGSFQAFDQGYLTTALKKLGPNFVGVTQLPATVTEAEIIELDRAGIRAVRFNLKRGGSEDASHLSRFAKRIYEIAGWHTELYVDSTALPDLYDTLIDLPAVSIDHLGLNKSGLCLLTKLAERNVHIKATGFSRVNFNVAAAIKDIYQANPNALMFGTDLPSTRAPTPYSDEDFILVADTLGDAAAEKVFSQNAIAYYKPYKNS
jgi:predicted TIM-barrel fold metal-dependent hydrolase